jgi:hypothetical protein
VNLHEIQRGPFRCNREKDLAGETLLRRVILEDLGGMRLIGGFVEDDVHRCLRGAPTTRPLCPVALE